jgi:FixJ family two-component response regulator
MSNRRIDNFDSASTVAIVEDERISRQALAALLSGHGYQTQAFASAEEMLDSVQAETQETPGVALVDVDLPGMSGLQLLARLRRKFPDLCAVLITAADDENVRRFCRENPVTYMRKPVNLSQLLSLLQNQQSH